MSAEPRPCVGCPFRRDCPDCPWSGENPPAATVSDARTGVADVTIGSVPRQRETAPAGAANTSCSGASPFKMGRTYRDGTP
jgi:hypothetical protein